MNHFRMKAETLPSSTSGRLFSHFQPETRSVRQPLASQVLTHHASTCAVSRLPAQTSSLLAAARASFPLSSVPPPPPPPTSSLTTPHPLELSHDRHTFKKYCGLSCLELSGPHLRSPLELLKCRKPVLSLHVGILTPGRAAGVGEQARALSKERTSKRPQSAPP